VDINGRVTQRDVDDAYTDWARAARDAPVGGTPVVEAFWRRFCRLDDEVNGKVKQGNAGSLIER